MAVTQTALHPAAGGMHRHLVPEEHGTVHSAAAWRPSSTAMNNRGPSPYCIDAAELLVPASTGRAAAPEYRGRRGDVNLTNPAAAPGRALGHSMYGRNTHA